MPDGYPSHWFCITEVVVILVGWLRTCSARWHVFHISIAKFRDSVKFKLNFRLIEIEIDPILGLSSAREIQNTTHAARHLRWMSRKPRLNLKKSQYLATLRQNFPCSTGHLCFHPSHYKMRMHNPMCERPFQIHHVIYLRSSTIYSRLKSTYPHFFFFTHKI